MCLHPLGCYHRITQTRWLIGHRSYSHMFSGVSVHQQCQLYSFWVTLVHRSVSVVCPHMLAGLRGLSGGLFYKGTHPTPRAPPSWPHYLPKALPNTTTLGIGFQHINLSGTQTLSVVMCLCWTRLQRACVEARYHSFNYLGGDSSVFSQTSLPPSFLPMDTLHLSFSRQWFISPCGWEVRPWGTEIHLAGKAAVMLSSAAWAPWRMKEMSSHIPKILSTCLFRCQVRAIYYVRFGRVLGLSKDWWDI